VKSKLKHGTFHWESCLCSAAAGASPRSCTCACTVQWLPCPALPSQSSPLDCLRRMCVCAGGGGGGCCCWHAPLAATAQFTRSRATGLPTHARTHTHARAYIGSCGRGGLVFTASELTHPAQFPEASRAGPFDSNPLFAARKRPGVLQGASSSAPISSAVKDGMAASLFGHSAILRKEVLVPASLAKEVLTEGAGPARPSRGQTVTAHYVGKLADGACCALWLRGSSMAVGRLAGQ
jgi:hypothetical protein